MSWTCPYAKKVNNYDSSSFILCKKKTQNGKQYKTLIEQSYVLCDYQHWCAVTHTRTVSEKGKHCKKFLGNQ